MQGAGPVFFVFFFVILQRKYGGGKVHGDSPHKTSQGPKAHVEFSQMGLFFLFFFRNFFVIPPFFAHRIFFVFFSQYDEKNTKKIRPAVFFL